MAYEIPVPSDDQTYSLVGDLGLMATTISQYLDQLAGMINQKPNDGSGASFSSIAVSGTGQFAKVEVNGTVANSSLINSTNGFGLNANGLTFLSKTTKWESSGNIKIPGGGSLTDATNFNDLSTALAPLLTRLTNLENIVGTLGANYVTQTAFTTSQNAQNVDINNRATVQNLNGKVNNYGGDINKAIAAHNADLVPGTGVSGRVADSSKVMGRMVTVGRANVGSVPANTSKSLKITYSARPAGITPVIFAQATADDGAVSIVCSVDDITSTSANIRYKNINVSGAESTYLNWLVI